MNIPFVVIVQPHLLKDKGSVRLRRVLQDDMEIGWNAGSTGSNEQFVPLQNLASTIWEMTEALGNDAERNMADESYSEAITGSNRPSTTEITSARSGAAGQVECVYIDQDQFFSEDMKISKSDTPHYKGIIKSIKGITQRSEAYLGSQLNSSGPTPVFAVSDVPFWVLREFGSSLMRRERKEQSALGAGTETIEKYPKGKRALKTLALAIDNLMKKRGGWEQPSTSHRGHSSSSSGSQLLTLLLYSKQDDRFDMVSLEGPFSQAVYNASSKRK